MTNVEPPPNPRNNCPARHLCETLEINMGCGSDICPTYWGNPIHWGEWGDL